MKKMFLTIASVLAIFGTVGATAHKSSAIKEPDSNIETVLSVSEINDTTPNIIYFYGIDKIVIKNDVNAHIKIYNDKWEIIVETNSNVNMKLRPGNYYVASDKKLKTHYITLG